jgi:hypothetical protein
MLNHNQAAIVLAIGLVAVLMTLASTRVFAQPTLPPNEENKVNNALHADEKAIALDHEHPEGINPPTFIHPGSGGGGGPGGGGPTL